MQKYGPQTSLAKHRREAVHREAMCSAIADEPDEPKAAEYAEVAAHAQRTIDAIDARAAELQRTNDVLTRGRALEKTRKLRTKKQYARARHDLAAEAEPIYRILLPHPPSALEKAGTKRAIAMVETAIGNLGGPDTPESVRAEHVPALENQLTRMREADLVEDEASVALSALRAGVIVFKAGLQRERESAYGMLVRLVGKAEASEFFLPPYTRRGDDIEDEGEEGGGEDADA